MVVQTIYTMKLNIVKVMEQVQAEKFTNKELHPYYGLADSRGWLTRYPKEGLRISAEDMAVFIKNGGSLDSEGVYGVNPYKAPVIVLRKDFYHQYCKFPLHRIRLRQHPFLTQNLSL